MTPPWAVESPSRAADVRDFAGDFGAGVHVPDGDGGAAADVDLSAVDIDARRTHFDDAAAHFEFDRVGGSDENRFGLVTAGIGSTSLAVRSQFRLCGRGRLRGLIALALFSMAASS